jgi:hypothetical protein
MLRHSPGIIVSALVFTGCCTSVTTAVRNGTDRDITLTMSGHLRPPETVVIRAGAKGRVTGVVPPSPYHSDAADSWAISDGHSVFLFADVTPIATMPRAFISSSRLTRDFPCVRVTQHVRLAPDMTVHAVRVIGYTASEPAPFPIHYTKKEDEK